MAIAQAFVSMVVSNQKLLWEKENYSCIEDKLLDKSEVLFREG
jgi:hypothetical protein